MKIKVSPGISQLRPYVAGKPAEELTRERGVVDVVKLASNENPVGPSPKALEAIEKALTAVHRYPDPTAYHLRGKLAAQHGVESSQIVFGNGSNELLELIVRTFTTGSDHIVFAEPSFVVYRIAALAHGVDYSAVPLKDGVHDLPAMAAAVKPNTKLVFIANPNNPTGTSVTQTEVLRLLKQVGEDVLVVLDEAYCEYVEDEQYPDSVGLLERYPNLIALRTFSKAYGLAGLRLGYSLSHPEVADYLNRVRAPFNANSLAQAAALVAFQDRAHLAQVVELNRVERQRVTEQLRGLGVVVLPSQANFVYAEFSRPAAKINEGLLSRGVIVRPVGGPKALRISIGLPQENDRMLQALKEVL